MRSMVAFKIQRFTIIVTVAILLIANAYPGIANSIPTFTAEPAATNAVRLLTTELHCTATGLPIPKVVSWMKNGEHVNFADGRKSILSTGTLRITNAQQSDDGYYQCVAKNTIGSVISKRAKLTVAYFDVFYASMEYKTQRAGSSLVLIPPSISCNPKAKYTWLKNGVKLSEDSRISVSTKDHSLYIADLRGSDAGAYLCQAENLVMSQAGQLNNKQDIKKVTLSIGAALPRYNAPSLIRSPKDTTARQGMDLTISFECFPNRSDTTITWKKNGAFISPNTKYRFDSTRKRLTINGPTQSDEGQYSCETSYLSSTATGSGNLRVIVPPRYLGQRPLENAKSDNKTILWCNATAYPTFTSKWYHNSRRVYTTGTKYQIRYDRSLLINRLHWTDAGVYQCISQNDAGQLMGTTRLNVLNETAVIVDGPRELYFHVSTTVAVPCLATGAPKPTITWLRNNIAVPLVNTRISVSSKGVLTITNAQKVDSATYTCVASNGAGQVRKSGYIGIVDPTRLIKGPNSTTTVARAVTVLLPCQVTHDPNVTIKWEWRKNTVKINDPRYSVLADGSLQILSTQAIDAARFTCNVYSNGGNASVSTVLNIVGLPLSPSAPVASEIGTTSLRLTWYAPEADGGSPLIDYELQIKNETSVVYKHLLYTVQRTVVVTGLQAGKKYKFRVAARNTLGTGRWSGETALVPLQILAPSQAPTHLRVVTSEQTKITLRWTPPPLASHNGDLKGYKVYYRIKGYASAAFNIKDAPPGLMTATSITYVLDNLLYFTQYEIKIAAFNDAGIGLMSSILQTETKPGVPSKAPTNVAINVVNSSAVEVSYNSPKQIYWNGELIASRGYAYDPAKPLDATPYDSPYNTATRYNQTFIIQGLKPYKHYALRVAVVTASGPSPLSDPVYFRMMEGSPGSVRNFMVTGTFAHAITLRWDRPLETNGVLQGYKVGHRVYGALSWIDRPAREPAYSNGAIFKGLQLNTRYEFYTLAFTAAGDGPRRYVDAQTKTTAPTLPGQPTKPMLVVSNGTSVTLNWLMGDTGGTLMTYYLIEGNNQTDYHQLTKPFHRWMLLKNLTRTQDIPAKVGNLTTNTIYRFRVTPFNSVGRGPTSNVSEDINTAESAPQAAPTLLRASAPARQELLIEWVPPPKYSWGSAAISYRIKLISIGKKIPDNIELIHPVSQAKSFRARGLSKWTRFNITVNVFNNVGKGPPGGYVVARTLEDVPDDGPAKIILTAVSSSVVNVTWTSVPINVRNGIILGYKIFYNIKTSPVVLTKHISSEKTRMSLLTELFGYSTYEVRMLAYTKTGDGKKTDPVQVITPEGIAGKPYRVRFPVVRVDFVKVTWQPPFHPNGAIQRYEVAYKLKGTSDAWQDVVQPRYGPDVLTADVSGLAGNRHYLFRVYARTSLGRGTPAEETVITTTNRVVPESPVILPISAADVHTTTVLVKWVAPYDGKSPIRAYSLQFNREPAGWVDYRSNLTNRLDIDATKTEILVAKLFPASSYKFRIRATNDVGNSKWSTESNSVMTHASAPEGAVRNIRIRPVSATSLRVEWQRPGIEEVTYLMRFKKLGAAIWQPTLTLPKTPLYKQIDNLEVYTPYEIAMAAQNAQGLGPWIKRTGVTGESRPTAAPTNLVVSATDVSTIRVQWTKPHSNTVKGVLLGYKINYQRMGVGKRRRKRRAIASRCQSVNNSPQQMTVGPYTEQAMIRNLDKFSKYKISVLAYNGAGDGPTSYSVYMSTPEGKPSAPFIIWSRGYSDTIDIQWTKPCFPGGHLTGYELQYSLLGSKRVSKRLFTANVFVARMHNLLSRKDYKIELKAGTRMGFGDSVTLYVKTTQSKTDLPGKPGKPRIAKIESQTMLLEWTEGAWGNTPIIKYRIQYKIADQGDWKVGWDATFDRWIRNDSRIQYAVTNLEPETRYSFRIIAVNGRGDSEPSERTNSLLTGKPKKTKPFHAETWFIVLLVVVALIIIALLILFICVKNRSKKSKYIKFRNIDAEREPKQHRVTRRILQDKNSTSPPVTQHVRVPKAAAKQSTKEQQLQQQSRDLKQYLYEDVKKKDLKCAYPDDGGGNEGMVELKDRGIRDDKATIKPKHKLEKSDLQPLQFTVPKPPDVSIATRRAPEGQDTFPRRRLSSPRESPREEPRYSYVKKQRRSIRRSFSSDEVGKEKYSDASMEDDNKHNQIRQFHDGQRRSRESVHRSPNRSTEEIDARLNRSYEMLPVRKTQEENMRRVPSRDGARDRRSMRRSSSRDYVDYAYDDEVFVKNAARRRSMGNSGSSFVDGGDRPSNVWELSADDETRFDNPVYDNRDRRRDRDVSLDRYQGYGREHDREEPNQRSRSRNSIRDRSIERDREERNWKSRSPDSIRDRSIEYDREGRNRKSRSRNSSRDRSIEYDREERNWKSRSRDSIRDRLGDNDIMDRRADDRPAGRDMLRRSTRGRDDHDRDHHDEHDKRSPVHQSPNRHRSDERDRERRRGHDDRRQDYEESPDRDYHQVISQLTRGRAGQRSTNENAVKIQESRPGMSSFEMAMVKNRAGSGQRLLPSDNEVETRPSRAVAAKRQRSTEDKRPLRNGDVDEKSESSISKQSDVSDNDADKSGNETDEDGRFVRGGKSAEANIASHYANDPFYKNWRSSLDKKTRKAILTEYHDRNKKKHPAGSVDSLGGSRPYRSASEEGLDRIGRPRGVRPGRSDLRQKKKLTQSDPYLNQEPEHATSSFTPSVHGSDEPPASSRARRPGRLAIDKAAARSEPSLNPVDSGSDSDGRFPPPYEGDEAGRTRRKNSFLRARDGDVVDRDAERRNSRSELEEALGRQKKKMAAELDRAVGYYTRAPPPYEDDVDYDSEAKSPPAYTPVQDSSDDSRGAYVGYNRGPRNWRPQRQQDRVTSPVDMEQRRVPSRRSDEFDGPTSPTSMTLV
eukprot:gene8937-9890_t